MYPRNAASPERISIGAVVQISDGAVQSSGVDVKVIPFGGSESSGAGTVAYSADGVVLYTPTQGETNYTSFILVASKTGCIPATVTVVTSAAGISGQVVITQSSIDQIGSDFLAHVLTKGSPGTIENTLWKLDKTNASAEGQVDDATPTASQFTTNLTGPADEYNDQVVAFTSGALTGEARAIELCTESGGVLTLTMQKPFTSAPADEDEFLILPQQVYSIAAIQAGLATLANQTAIKAVTDKLNTGLVADGQLFQFTANMLELAPGGSGGGSATLENQELILDEIDSLRSSFASAVGRLAVSAQLIGFPPSIVRNSDYSTVTESEIRLSLKDVDGNAITEIGGIPCDEITWLFGLGSERSPAIIEGAATWDDANDQLVIQLAAADTADKPTGTLTWQIGCTIDETTRYLGGGTTRLVERHF